MSTPQHQRPTITMHHHYCGSNTARTSAPTQPYSTPATHRRSPNNPDLLPSHKPTVLNVRMLQHMPHRQPTLQVPLGAPPCMHNTPPPSYTYSEKKPPPAHTFAEIHAPLLASFACACASSCTPALALLALALAQHAAAYACSCGICLLLLRQQSKSAPEHGSN